MVVRLHGERPEPPLINVPGAGRLMLGMPALCMSQRQPPHELRQLAVGARQEQQVEMCGHQAIGQQARSASLYRLGQCLLECRVIVVPGEYFQVGVAAIQRMVNQAALGGSERSAH